MSLSVRFYLFADDGLQRISQRLMHGLALGNDAMPQYAGTKQKAADVIVEVENGKPVRIARADGNFLTFDKRGQVYRDLVAGGMEAMETFAALERAERRPSSKVVGLTPKLKREKWERDNRWTLSKQDLDLISDDIWKRKSDSSDHPPRSRPFHRPPRCWLRQPGDWRATPTTTLASAGSLLALEYTSMERSERSTSARDTLLAYRHSLAVAV